MAKRFEEEAKLISEKWGCKFKGGIN